VNHSIPDFFRSSISGEADSSTTSSLRADPQAQTSALSGQGETAQVRQAPAAHAPTLKHRLSLNHITTFPWCLSQDLVDYEQAGMAAIGLNWRKLTQYGLRRSIRRVLESRLPVSSLGCLGGFTGEHGYSQHDVLADGRRMIRVAGQLRAGTLTVVTGPQGGHIRSNANRLVVEALKELVPLAALYGIQLALQPMHPMFAKGWSFIHSLDETLVILDRVKDSRLKMAFGTYHLWQEPQLFDRLAELTPRIGLVRLADWGDVPRHDHDRLLPGEGRLPLSHVIRTLENNRYSGWYELEVWSRDLWKQDRRDLMQACVLARDYLSAPFPA